MDEKSQNRYPVYMINEEYGIRGLDFRAIACDFGAAQFICSPFSNLRNRHQCLMRVGRFGDDCIRIQDTAVEDVDEIQMQKYRGDLLKDLEYILKMQSAKPKLPLYK